MSKSRRRACRRARDRIDIVPSAASAARANATFVELTVDPRRNPQRPRHLDEIVELAFLQVPAIAARKLPASPSRPRRSSHWRWSGPRIAAPSSPLRSR
jgi:hypothetical protein